MKKALIGLFALFVCIPLFASATTPKEYEAYARHEAKVNGVNAEHLVATLKCEAHFNPHAVSETNDYGIAQINLYYHPEVTYKQAMSPYWSIDWAIDAFANDHANWYSCWRRLYS